MSDRPSVKSQTPDGKSFELKSYLNARERNELRKIYLNVLSFDIANPAQLNGEIPAGITDEYEKILLDQAVISFDGSNEKNTERILDGSPENYDFIVAEANKIVKGNFNPAKQPTVGDATSPTPVKS